VQRFYLELSGAGNTDVLHYLRSYRQSILGHVPEFRSFIAGGFSHTILLKERFYYYHSDGNRLRDWVAAIVAGEPVASIDCDDDCNIHGLMYSERDLRIIGNTIELLSMPGAWNPKDAPGRCPAQADQYSLRCAMVQVEQQLTGQTYEGTHNLPPAFWDVIYTVMERIGERRIRNPLGVYNNHPDTTAEDMIVVLEEVRGRISKSLDANR
jgi:hypothetical protein